MKTIRSEVRTEINKEAEMWRSFPGAHCNQHISLLVRQPYWLTVEQCFYWLSVVASQQVGPSIMCSWESLGKKNTAFFLSTWYLISRELWVWSPLSSCHEAMLCSLASRGLGHLQSRWTYSYKGWVGGKATLWLSSDVLSFRLHKA